MNNQVLLVAAMALVTYLPRMIPMVFIKDIKMPKRLRVFFQFIPFAALGALIFPDILYSTSGLQSALAGTAAAVVIAALKANVMFVVLGSIFAVFLYSTLL